MKTKISTFLSLFFITTSLLAQINQEIQYEWAVNFGGTSDEVAKSIAIDPSGNIYTVGNFEGTVDFNPDPTGVFNLTSNGYTDIFVTKMDSLGNLLWAKNFGGSSNDYRSCIAIDTAGYIVITGKFYGTSDFDPGVGTFNLSSNGATDIFVCKLSSSGYFIWAKSFGSSNEDWGNSIEVNTAGEIYVSGIFNEIVDFDPGVGVHNLIGTYANFILILDASGNFEWAAYLSEYSNQMFNLSLDPYGNIYATGLFDHPHDFDPGPGAFYLPTSSSFYDFFIIKFDKYHNFKWVKSIGGYYFGRTSDIVADTAGNVYICGYFEGMADFNPDSSYYYLNSNEGEYAAFILKLDSSGSFVWAKHIVGTSDVYAHSIELDNNGNIYIAGNFEDTTDFKPGTGIYNLTTSGGSDFFILKLDEAGNFFWCESFGGTSDDYAYSLHVDSIGNIHVAGAFENTVNFDPGAGVSNITSAGNSDAFVFKLSQTQPLIANFYATDTLFNFGDTIKFYEISNAEPNSWYWDFGDGTFDNIQNPAHVYQSTGTYSVTLIVSDGTNIDTLIKTNYIDIIVPASTESEVPEFEWVQTWGGSDNDVGKQVLLDTDGNVYIISHFRETADFDPGVGVSNLTSVGMYDYSISKFDKSGNFIWVRSFGSSANDYYSSDIDSLGNVYTAGFFNGTFDTDPGSGVYNLTSSGENDIFIHKIDSSGSFLWSKRIGGILNDGIQRLQLDASGNILVSGYFNGTVDFDPGFGTNYLTANGSNSKFISKFDSSGNLIWALDKGTQYDFLNNSDAQGNIYFSGIFENTFDFDPGPGVYNLTSNGSQNMFISKFDNNGNIVWAKSFDGTGNQMGRLVVDSEGNIYATGRLWGTTDLDPDTSVYTLSSNGEGDVFILKMNASGSLIWAKNMGGYNGDYSYSIALDADENIYTTGTFGGGVQIADYDPGPEVYNIITNGNHDLFISKLDSGGNFVWAVSMGGVGGDDCGNDIFVDNAGKVYVTGIFEYNVDFDPGPGVANRSASGPYDAFVLKLSQKLKAQFVASETEIFIGDTVQFTDLSNGNPTIWFWDFGDGVTDTIQNPIHIYQTNGTFSVSLTVSEGTNVDSLLKADYISVSHLQANFIASDTMVAIGETVQFADLTAGNPSSWFWDFGDGSTSTLQNPTHSYQNLGSYTVTLIATDSVYTDTLTIYNYIVVSDLQANFMASASLIPLGETINFTDLSTGNPISWLWEFGDGTTASIQNPSHIYQDTGTYTVSLIISNGMYSDLFVLVNYIVVSSLNANFEASETISHINETINFTDLSTGNPTNWLWDFGDGTISTAQNPSHTFQSTGFYSVKLAVSNSLETDSIEFMNYIEIIPITFPYGWFYSITSTSHIIIVSSSTEISINNIPIENGDYIGVFYDSLNTLACGGYLMWEGSSTVINAWYEDEGYDGFAVGEEFKWKIWDASKNITYDANADYMPVPPMTDQQYFVLNGSSGLVSLTALDSQIIDLPLGWSIFSTYINPFYPDISDLMAPIISDIEMVKSGTGLVFWPAFSINQIGDLTLGQGYQVKTLSSTNLIVYGSICEPIITPVSINSGWNLIGYLRTSPAPIDTMLSSIVNEIVLAKNGFGLVYWPVYNINNIGNMIPGEGYQVKMNVAGVLVYPPN